MAAFTWIATAQHDLLPILLSDGRYTPVMFGVVSAVWCLSLAASSMLWLRKPHSILDVWLMVVMCAWLFDIALVGDPERGAFDVGFYLGRIYGLCAASFVLAVLLIDNVGLQANWPACWNAAAGSRLGKKSPHRTRKPFQRGRGIIQRRHHHQLARRHHHRLERGRRTLVRL